MAAPDTPSGPPKLAPPGPGRSAAGDEFTRLVAIMRTLRSPDGCPWDREQTYRSLSPYVLEEAHEVVDAIDRGDMQELRDEIGDLIFEGVFLAQLAAEEGAFTAEDAVRSVNEKLVRRHPHVFESAEPPPGADDVTTPRQVVAQWEEIKQRERAANGRDASGPMDRIPRSLPALMAAFEIGTRAAGVGFDWPAIGDVIGKVREEVEELAAAFRHEGADRAAEEMGDLLFAMANLSRKLGIEPEAALRAANRKFLTRFRAMHESLSQSGRALESATLDEMEAVWSEVKRNEAAAQHTADASSAPTTSPRRTDGSPD